ncbi:response regulator [Stenotrophomonas sp. AB1(2024)]|uniref:response regulator n=1 Tax=Stenotrophomonas sp. AB1(2024) TaxID=3132215 RepID=UPI0030A264D5
MHRLLPRLHSSDAPLLAATVLLRWLSLCVMACLVGTAGFYLLAQLSNDISVHRREMNATAYRAQLYFDQREALLNYLADSVVTSTTAHSKVAPTDDEDGDVQRLALGRDRDGHRLSLLLSARAAHTLDDYGAQLIHVGNDPHAPRRLLHGDAIHAVPSTDLTPRLLQEHAARAPAGTQVYWLASTQGPQRIYLYRAAGVAADPAHWLVLSLDPGRIAGVVNSKGIGDFLLLDRQDRHALSNRAGVAIPPGWLQAQREDIFTFVWTHALPHGLALVKSIGEDGWRLVYYLPLSLLLGDIALHIAVSLVLCAAALAALRLLMRRIDRQLIQPARHQHRQLMESFAFGSTVIEMAPVGICVLRSQDGTVMLENQLACDWLGADTFSGDWLGSWRPSPDLVSHPARLRRGTDFTTQDGRQLQVLYATTRYHDADVVLCVFSDISRHRQIQAALSAAKQSADEASQAKSTFVATMSHEIRTPLYGVLGTLELLGNTTLDARQARYLRTIQQSSSVLLQLISDILDVSKIESGRLSLAAAPFSPQALAETTLGAYAAAATQKGLQVMVSTDPRLPAQVIGDADRIRQVLGNLLSNAIKFTHSGRIFLRVRQVAREGGTASISWQVTDTGIGIAAAEQARLFEPFRQVSGQSRKDGTGLGLSISDHLARLMNGELRLVSDRGLGSSFTMTLPLTVAGDEDARVEGPRLLPQPPIYVRTALPELTDNACLWFRRWGANAQRYNPEGAPPETGAILIDADPQHGLTTEWTGPRVVTSVDADEQPEVDPLHPERLIVSMFSIRAIARAAGQLQHGHAFASHAPCVPPPDAVGLHVLVAEDNPINRLILKEQLEALGCSVVTVSDGGEALERTCTERFDVLLTDINMPGMGGHELIAQLRQRGSTLTVIGATANATPEERERCLAAGMDGYMVKPINIGSLRHALTGLSTGVST